MCLPVVNSKLGHFGMDQRYDWIVMEVFLETDERICGIISNVLVYCIQREVNVISFFS